MDARPPITKESVESTMAKIRTDGKNPSVAKIRAIIGGSDSTIARLKREIEAEKALPLDSPEALDAFRAVWSKAIQVGVAQQAQIIEELKEDYASVLADNEQMDGRIIAAEAQNEKLRQRQEELQAQLAEAQAQATQARANSENDARQLAEALARLSALQERCALEEANLHGRLTDATATIHEMEVRAAGQTATIEQLKTRSEMAESRCSQLEGQKNQLEAQSQKLGAELIDLRAVNRELSLKLSDSEARHLELRAKYDEELPKLQKALDASTVKCHATELELARLHGQLDAKEKPAVACKKVSSPNKQPHSSGEKVA